MGMIRLKIEKGKGKVTPFGGIRAVFLLTGILVYIASGVLLYFDKRIKTAHIKMSPAGRWLFIALRSLFLMIPLFGTLWALAWECCRRGRLNPFFYPHLS